MRCDRCFRTAEEIAWLDIEKDGSGITISHESRQDKEREEKRIRRAGNGRARRSANRAQLRC